MNGEVTEAPFLIFDNLQENQSGRSDRILAFSSPDCMRLLSQARTWFMDGNFAMAPKIFRQVYVIRIPFYGSYLTCLYGFLPSKKRKDYEEFFRGILDKISEMGLELTAEETITDFEMSVISAIQSTFPPNVRIRGCYYHLNQSFWRKIRMLGLEERYNSDVDFRILARMLPALAFLPLNMVETGMSHIAHLSDWDNIPNGKQLLEYFEDTYVRQSLRTRQYEDESGIHLRFERTPRVLFPPAVWNVHEATLHNSPRTNNICEG